MGAAALAVNTAVDGWGVADYAVFGGWRFGHGGFGHGFSPGMGWAVVEYKERVVPQNMTLPAGSGMFEDQEDRQAGLRDLPVSSISTGGFAGLR